MPPSEQAHSTSSGLTRRPALGSPAVSRSNPPAVSRSNPSMWFSEDVKPYEPALRAYLLKRFPSLPDHDDIVQETYTRLLRVKENGRLTFAKAFLFTAARNVAIDMFRRRRLVTHEPISDFVELPLLEETPDVIATLERQQRLELLIEAVAALPERCRQVMMLRHLDGLSYKDIAARLGISPETVKVHVVKGVRDCTAFFRQHGLLDGAAGEAPPRIQEPKDQGTKGLSENVTGSPRLSGFKESGAASGALAEGATR